MRPCPDINGITSLGQPEDSGQASDDVLLLASKSTRHKLPSARARCPIMVDREDRLWAPAVRRGGTQRQVHGGPASTAHWLTGGWWCHLAYQTDSTADSRRLDHFDRPSFDYAIGWRPSEPCRTSMADRTTEADRLPFTSWTPKRLNFRHCTGEAGLD